MWAVVFIEYRLSDPMNSSTFLKKTVNIIVDIERKFNKNCIQERFEEGLS
jgi:hypothetical protein